MTIYDGICKDCRKQIRRSLTTKNLPFRDVIRLVGHECGDHLFCEACWSRLPIHIQKRCIND